ncbi:MAG: iron-containing alcohol dehydrogenase [Clostridia bacterium]|nr:iron-containing alcohol dehydrogenase [Clostridia bacterium]
MNFSMYMPVNVKSGLHCVKENSACFALGRHALLVTGRHAAKACGAQADVTAVLDELGIAYTVYDCIGENPLMSVCYEGGQTAARVGADFVIGIGGGSAMDAAKAVAAYAANPAMTAEALMTATRENRSLPIILIPTTAGTGSEVNPYAVLTLDGQDKKWTFKDFEQAYAKYAFLDARYTASLSEKYTLSCALDAFAHCAESYLSPKGDALSRMFAGWGARILYAFIRDFKAGEPISLETREALLYASCAGGIAINKTGTGFPHPLGYNITLMRGVPHGAACGAFYREYLTFNEKGDAALCQALYDAIGADGEEIKTVIPEKSGVDLMLDADTIAMFVGKVKGAGNYKNSPYVINEQEMTEIYTRLFGEDNA